MKKILLFSLAYYPKFVGGAEVAIKEITDRLDPNEYSFDMITLRFDSLLPKVEKIGNITVHRIGFGMKGATIKDLGTFPLFLNKIWFQFAAPFKARALHKKNHYDALWAMMAHSSGVPAAIFNFLEPKIPYVLTLQEGDPIDYIKIKMLPFYPLFVAGFRKAAAIQAISTFLGKWARDMGFAGHLEIIPNGVNTLCFSQAYPEEEIASLKKHLNKDPRDIFLVTASRLVRKNAVDDVIRALTFLPEYVKFLILGIGPDETKLRELAKALGVEFRVRFLGQVEHKDLPKYLKVSDIFIRPSLSEGMGNAFIEAMASGIPVIATQEGGIADFLFDPLKNQDKEPTGRAVSARDPKGIAEAVESMLRDKETTEKIVKNAQRLVFDKYDWNLVAKDMKEKIFDRLLS